MKEYFFWMDSRSVPHVPQPAQRILAENYVSQLAGKIVYYSGEDWITAPMQVGLKEKIKRASTVDGFIFFTIQQFNYGASFNFSLMKQMLTMGFEMHFSREAFSLYTLNDLHEKFNRLYLYDVSSAQQRRFDLQGELLPKN